MRGITRTILFILSLLNHTAGFSQRYDFNWVFGYDGGKGDPKFGTTLVDFNSGNPTVSFAAQGKMVIFETNASISDKDGNLLYYTNGYDVEDANFKKVAGATNLGIKYWDGLHANQGALFLEKPKSDSICYLIYINLILNSPIFFIQDLKYLEINKINNKVFKQDTIVFDTLNEGCLTASRHANGRDWWIILNKLNTNLFYKYLLTTEGIIFIGTQNVGPTVKEGYGQAVFSPNGEYFALLDAITFSEGLYIKLYKFDRCNGNLEFIRMGNFPTSSFSGISFSPNSRYLYYSEQKNLYQFDLQDHESFSFLDLIDTIESQTAWGSQYNLHQLGPDGRIYISNAYSNFVMHRINKPNEKGIACLPKSNSFALKTLGGYGIPNMPNYRLGPLDGSTCDTLGIDNIPWAWWRHDQDTSDYLNFEFTDLSAYEVTDWEWNFGDGMVSTLQNPLHRYSQKGVYEVCLISKNKNGADTLCKTLNVGTTSTKNDLDQIKIEILPNPCKEYFIINVLDYNPENMLLELFDLNEKLVLSQRLYEGSNGIELGNFSRSVYFVKILEQGRVIKIEKLMKWD